MHDFTRKLITELRKIEIPFKDQGVLIAVSGGADSCALALATGDLSRRGKLANRIRIAHFNHGLRGAESDSDAAFVKGFAEDQGLEFIGGVAEVDQVDKKDSIEQAARMARYQFLVKAAKESRCDVILTAHTINDQAETFLINLLRGSGLEGLSAMRVTRKIGAGEFGLDDESFGPLLVRPLLSWATREDTERFVADRGIEVCNDSMNEDLTFTRVRVRKELIPLMKEFNPKSVFTLARTARLLRTDSDILKEIERISTADLTSENGDLALKDLFSVAEKLRGRIVRLWLKEKRGNLRRLEEKHIDAITALASSKKSGRKVELPMGETVIKANGKLIFRALEVEK